jgi:ribonuclease G
MNPDNAEDMKVDDAPAGSTGSPQGPAQEPKQPEGPKPAEGPRPERAEGRVEGQQQNPRPHRRRRGRGGRGGRDHRQQGQNPAAPQPPAQGEAQQSEASPPPPPQGQRRQERQRQGRQGGEREPRPQRERGDRQSGRQGGEKAERGERGERGERQPAGRQGGERGERGDRERGELTNDRKPTTRVKKEILVNASFEETRIAILENDRLCELLWERQSQRNTVGNIYKGVVENVLPGINSAFVNIGYEKNAYLYITDVVAKQRGPIDQMLKKGQTIMCQVAKEAISTKGAKITMDVSLPGRYLVFTSMQPQFGISKHIESADERKRLEALVQRLSAEHLGGKGIVVRTEAEGTTDADLDHEVRYLARLWEGIARRMESMEGPGLLHKDLDLALQVARDLLTDEVVIYLVDNRQVHKELLDFVSKISPDLADRVKLYEAKTPIFTAFGVEPEIERLRQSKLHLPNGGTIVIQEAESLCAIDVNTGRFTGSKSQEETVTQTNIEAAEEVAHQLRLRNIGGIIVVDFIDMKRASNRHKVMDAMQKAVERDRAKIRILPITRLGLIEMTRERKRESTVSLLTDDCPECKGSGRVLSVDSMRIKLEREIHDLTQGRPGGNIRILLHPLLAEAMRREQAVIEKNVHRAVGIQADPQLTWEDYRIILE